MSRKVSLRGAINAFCRWCIYDPTPGEGTWRAQVTACTSTTCPLYSSRPCVSGGQKAPKPGAEGGISA